jgi:hypothetical protein
MDTLKSWEDLRFQSSSLLPDTLSAVDLGTVFFFLPSCCGYNQTPNHRSCEPLQRMTVTDDDDDYWLTGHWYSNIVQPPTEDCSDAMMHHQYIYIYIYLPMKMDQGPARRMKISHFCRQRIAVVVTLRLSSSGLLLTLILSTFCFLQSTKHSIKTPFRTSLFGKTSYYLWGRFSLPQE